MYFNLVNFIAHTIQVLELFKSNDSIIVNSEVLLDFLCKKNRAHNFEVFELKMIKDLLMSEILKVWQILSVSEVPVFFPCAN